MQRRPSEVWRCLGAARLSPPERGPTWRSQWVRGSLRQHSSGCVQRDGSQLLSSFLHFYAALTHYAAALILLLCVKTQTSEPVRPDAGPLDIQSAGTFYDQAPMGELKQGSVVTFVHTCSPLVRLRTALSSLIHGADASTQTQR